MRKNILYHKNIYVLKYIYYIINLKICIITYLSYKIYHIKHKYLILYRIHKKNLYIYEEKKRFYIYYTQNVPTHFV